MSPIDPTSSEGLTIEEVAARAGVTPRTVHYYVAQGLLPGPGKQGPRTRYSPAFLDLLLRIRLLQHERDLSLRSIRQMFEREGVISPGPRTRRSSRDVRASTTRATDRHREADSPESPERVLDAHGKPAHSDAASTSDAPRAPGTSRVDDSPDHERSDGIPSPTVSDLLAALRRLVGERRVPSAGSGDRWVTIPISRDLVLAGRRLRNDDLQALQRAADHLRFILLNGARS